MYRKFRNPNFSGRLEWLPTQFVSTVSPEKSMEKRDTPTEHKSFRRPKDS